MKTGGMYLIKPVGEEEIFTREKFSEEQNEIAMLTEEFATEQILPKKKEIEKLNGELTCSIMKQLGDLGLLGVDVPEAYGGLGLGKVTSTIINEKVTMGQSGSFGVTFSAHTGIGTLPIVLFGSEEQKMKYLPKLGSGEWISAYGLTEPGAGSDALAARTTAVLTEDGKEYILNGTKQFISNAAWCKLIIVYAKVDGEHFTAFLVETATPGVEIGPEEVKMGYKGSSTASIILNDVHVPIENVLGIIGKGHQIAFNILNIGRYKLGAADLGASKACINEANKYALERHQFGQPIANFGAIKSKFANMIVRTYDLDSILYRTVGDIDDSISQISTDDKEYYKHIVSAIETFATEASMVKVYGSEALWLTSDDGIQVFGGYGYTEEYPLAAVARDTRVDRIFEGTNEINRQIIAGHFLKKALTEELPFRDRIKELKTLLAGKKPDIKSTILKAEKTALEYAKAITLYVFNESIIKYGQGLRNEQQLGEMLADMFTDIYVMDSVLSRVTYYIEKKGSDQDRIRIAKISVADKVNRIISHAKIAMLSILDGDELDKALADLDILAKGAELRTRLFQLKSDLADSLYEKGKYSW
ncbi:MAG: acyl-CoA dehydrogenase family protein [Calditrichaceae bacterium]